MAKRITVKESMAFLSDGHVNHITGERSKHIDKEYKVVSDIIDAKGRRHIVLKEKDLTDFYAKIDKAVDLILEKLGEGESKTARGLLKDVLGDYKEKHIDDIITRIQKGKSVKIREGCYKIIIGDGRKNSGIQIMLRE